MKRAFPQKVKPVSCYPSTVDAEAGQPKETPSGVNRRARTSAAMIGLALSMGASSLLLPRQNDRAAAAESIATESTVAIAPLAYQVAVLPSPNQVESDAPEPTVVEHVVREGQTLWQLSRLYRVRVEAIASTNGIDPNSVVHAGQTLRIPASGTQNVARADVAQEVIPVQLVPESARARGVEQPQVVNSPTAAPSTDDLKAERDNALSRLRQERDKLRNSLAELRTEDAGRIAAEPPKSQAVAEQLQAPAEEPDLVTRFADSVAVDEPEVVLESGSTAVVAAHQVKPGETLSAIAQSYGVTQRQLATTNNLSDPDWLRVNQSLVIPQTQAFVQPSQPLPSVPTPTPASVPSLETQPVVVESEEAGSTSVVYRVNPGDTLVEIARTHDISQASLLSVNNLSDPNVIRAGQVLRIPTAEPASAPATVAVDGVDLSSPAAVASVSPAEQIRGDVVPAPEGVVQVPTVVTTPTVPDGSVAEVQVADARVNEVPQQETQSAESDVKPSAGFVAANQPSSSSQVAAAPLSTSPESDSSVAYQTSASASGTNPFVENLMSEIHNLRDRYRANAGTTELDVQPPTVVAAVPDAQSSASDVATGASAINPEFTSVQSRDRSDAEPAEAQAQSDANADSAPAASRPRLMAVAPLGSENYEPLLRPAAGQLVSPDLPPLPGPENFLPNSPTRSSGYIWPARGVLTSGYGWRWGRMHRGIDIGAPVGTPVYAAAPGVIEHSGWNSGGYGNMVEIRHDDGTMTRYAHHSRNLVRVGQRVEQGQEIALVGSTGYSTGPHLHFEVHLPNQGTVNPIAYLPR